MSTLRGTVPDMAQTARMASEAMDSWLRDLDGYRGLIMLTDQSGGVARIITLWESSEAEVRARATRATMRDRLSATAGMTVEGLEIYELPVMQVLPAPTGA
jgi:hypothetical protein